MATENWTFRYKRWNKKGGEMSERSASYRDEEKKKRCWLVQATEELFLWAYEEAESKCSEERHLQVKFFAAKAL